jgi:glycosyltransferase involved in cell wall biosynthesis
MNIFIVIPFYNEQKHITTVVKDLLEYRLPIILIDDGSNDGYESKINNLKSSSLTLLKHKINLGKGAAMKTGADYAFANGADAIIFMDGDGQHKPEDLPKFIKALKTTSADIVFGSRNYSYGVPLIRFLGNKLASVVLTVLFGIYVSDVLCGYKGLTKKAYKKVRWNSIGYGVETEIVVRTGKMKLDFCEIPVQSIYHDKVKGVTMLDAFEILWGVIKWRFTI